MTRIVKYHLQIVCIFCIITVAPRSTYGQSSNDSWANAFGNPVGINGEIVFAVCASPNGDVYFGGDFVTAGNVVANGIAKWDGKEWSSFGSALIGHIYTILADSFDVYVGGDFYSNTLGEGEYSVAKWNGSSWQPLAFTSGDVRALAFDQYKVLYAGGAFDGRNLAQWNGSAWIDVPGVNSTVVNGRVYSILFDQNTLYVGGQGGYNYLSSRSNGVWKLLKTFDAPPLSIIKHNGGIVIGGGFTNVGGSIISGIVRWDGSTFSKMAEFDFLGHVNALASIQDSGLLVGGFFRVKTTNGFAYSLAKWSAGNWQPVVQEIEDASNTRMIYGLTSVAGKIYIAGSFDNLGTVAASRVAVLIGETVEPIAINTNGITRSVNAMTADTQGNLFVGAGYNTVRFGNLVTNGIAKWNGTTWDSLGSGVNFAADIAVGKKGELYVAGCTKAGSLSVNYIARWDGTAWDSLGSGITNYIWDTRVSSLAIAPNGDLYAAGTFWYAGGVRVSNVARWDGTNWHSVGGFGVGVNCIAVTPSGELYAGLGSPGGGVFRYNGTNWESLPGTGGWLIDCIIAVDNSIYFTGALSFGIYCWDGVSVKCVGQVPHNGTYTNLVSALARNGSELFAAGDFIQIDSLSFSSIARWDGKQWHSLGNGLDHVRFSGHSATKLVAVHDGIYVGGLFSVAGGAPSSNIALWNTKISSVTQDQYPKEFMLLNNYPNPFNPTTTIEYSIPSNAFVTLKVFNLLGQIVATLVNQKQNAGRHQIRFDGTFLSSGIYLYRLQAADFLAVKKFVLLK